MSEIKRADLIQLLDRLEACCRQHAEYALAAEAKAAIETLSSHDPVDLEQWVILFDDGTWDAGKGFETIRLSEAERYPDLDSAVTQSQEYMGVEDVIQVRDAIKR